MRKLLMLSVALVALGAAFAPAASAINADFPRGDNFPFPDTDAEDWVKAEVKTGDGESCAYVVCEFEAVANGSWDWRFRPYPSQSAWLYVSCQQAQLAGSFLNGGWFLLSGGDWHHDQLNGLCQLNSPIADDAMGEICGHVSTGEVWVRSQVGLASLLNGHIYGGPGVTFGRLAGDGEELSSMSFGGPGYVDTEIDDGGYDFAHRVEFAVDGPEGPYEIDVPDEDTVPCEWAELS